MSLCTRIGCDVTSKYTCSRCKSARYCSVECQKLHYPEHKAACKSMIKWTNKAGYDDAEYSRMIGVNDNDYRNIVDTIARGEAYYLNIGSDVNPMRIVKRIDGKYYDKESGSMIISESEFKKESAGGVVHRFTNFDDLVDSYGQPEDTVDNYCLFVDRNKKRIIILNKLTDEIFKNIDAPNLNVSAKIKLIKEGNALYVREV